MAGKIPSSEELSKAIEAYCNAHDGVKEYTQSEEELKQGIHRLTDANDIEVTLGPWPKCSSQSFFEAISLIIAENRDASPQERTVAVRPAGRITSRSQAGSVPGSALEAVRGCQATEKATYSTGKGKTAAAAKTNIAALMEAGGSLEIMSRQHSPDFIFIEVRAILADRHVDSSMSIYKQEYLAKKAWDWIVKVLMDEPGIVTGTDDYGMPEFKEGATIKVRLSDEGKSILVPLPAKIALWREMAREWQFAGRVCETKAYSRAADMLLRGDFQSAEELSEEQSEVSAIKENAKAEAGV